MIFRPAIREQEVQRAILDFLKATGILHWRCNLGGVRLAGKGRGRNPMKGFPDIACVVAGRLIGIEVKRPGAGGNLSPEQREWRDKLIASGAGHVVATSVEDVRRALQAASAHVAPPIKLEEQRENRKLQRNCEEDSA